MSVENGPVLNPGLVHALQKLGRVLIGNRGQPAELRITHKVIRGQVRKVADVGSWGEYYHVDCPFCCDTRGRLNFCHLWGTADPVTGRPMLHLVKCQNENCYDSHEARESLKLQLFGLRNPPQAAARGAVTTGGAPSVVAAAVARIVLPENFTGLLEPSCPAAPRRYLESRGFDPDELAATWHVGYSAASIVPPPSFNNCLVIPLHDVKRYPPSDKPPETSLVGWQTRALDDHSTRYLFATGTPKSRLLYGLPQALETDGPIAIVEGATDVWRIGSHAVAILGKSPSPEQLVLLRAFFHGRPLVIALDADAAAEAQKTLNQLRQQRRLIDDKAQVVVASLPVGRKDIGECSREEARNVIARALRSSE